MERQLFEWGEWGIEDDFVYVFYDCELKVWLDRYPPGTFIDTIRINYHEGELKFFDGREYKRFKLSLHVIEEL